MLDCILDALLDTVKVAPILFIVYIVLELLEYRGVIGFENSPLMKGKLSPVFGALFGCVPQCGFSVLSTDLYANKKISIGALIAVFISTSDEALPIMIADINAIPSLIVLILVKLVFGISVGYLSLFLYKKLFKSGQTDAINGHNEEKGEDEKAFHNGAVSESESGTRIEHHHPDGCCHHNIEKEKFDVWHPVLHCIKISLFILVVNLVLGIIIHFIGEDKLTGFLNKSSAIQPLLAVLIGLIPNCASSLVITELYLAGGLSFGAIVAGLSVNAGLGLVVLLKENKSIKENIFIVSMLIIPSLIVGYLLHFLVTL